ncbi:MAG TPA: hypothetical protein VF507_10520, partial [Pyrinomonadaceae bacterium]
MLTTRSLVLMIGAVLLIAAGGINFAQRWKRVPPPTDGVDWVDTKSGIVARSVTPDSTAARAGVMPGDRLLAVSPDEKETNREEVDQAWKVQVYLEEARVGGQLHYLIERPSYPEETRYYWADLYSLEPLDTWNTRDLYLNLIGLIYLCVGFFVLFKQGAHAPFVLHFATLCLAAFVLHFYKPVGTFKDLDLAVAFLKNAAFILFAPLFLHFCAIYPTRYHLSERRRRLALLLYAPALALLAVAVYVYFPLPHRAPSADFIGGFYKVSFAHFVLALLASAVLLVRTFVRSESAVVRQQLKWVVWGSALAIAPFTLLYAAGYLFGAGGESWMTDAAVLPLILIPLSFGYSVVRYRLMDVELVVRRGLVYTLTTLSIALMIGAVVYSAGLYALSGDVITSGEITLRVIIAIAAMAVIVMIAAPFKNFLQERVDRLFFGERYD